ncbi:hypothetical protein ACSQ67_017794 [Phaseolus vulgaris]
MSTSSASSLGGVSLQAMDSSHMVIAAFFLLPNFLTFLFKRVRLLFNTVMNERKENQERGKKMVVDAVRDLLQEANIDSATGGFSLQAMDSSHGHRRLPPPSQRPHLPLRKS